MTADPDFPGPRHPRRGGGVSLVGYRGTGKSTVGRILADLLGRPFVDADARLEAHFARPISEVFRVLGEPAFRDGEEQVLSAITSGPAAVVATGGGVVLRPTNRARLKGFGLVVWLKTDASILAARLSSDPRAVADRPTLTGAGTLAEINDVLSTRVPLYREVADLEIVTDGLTPREVAGAILSMGIGPILDDRSGRVVGGGQ
jgi:shikimate kinase